MREFLIAWKHPAPAWIERRDPVVWIDIGLVDAAWQSAHDYIGPSGTGRAIAGRYEKFGRWLVDEGKSVEMPSIGLFPEGSVAFTDGRHRFAWLRDHGAICLPIAVCHEDLAVISARFGSTIRECLVYH